MDLDLTAPSPHLPHIFVDAVGARGAASADVQSARAHLLPALVRTVAGALGAASATFSTRVDDGLLASVPAAVDVVDKAPATADLVHSLGCWLSTLETTTHEVPLIRGIFGADELEPGDGDGRWRLSPRSRVRRPDALITPSLTLAEYAVDRLGVEAYVVGLAPHPLARPVAPRESEQARRALELPATFVLDITDVGGESRGLDVAAIGRALDVTVVRGADLPEAERHALHGSATVVACADGAVGFGTSVVDAVARGAAVVATGAGALPEIFGRALELAAPGDEDAFAALLSAALRSDREREERRLAAVEALSPLSWGATASRTLNVYADLGIGPGGSPIIDLRNPSVPTSTT